MLRELINLIECPPLFTLACILFILYLAAERNAHEKSIQDKKTRDSEEL